MRTICLAEESEALRLTLESHLRARGFAVDPYSDGASAWSGILETNPEILIVSSELTGLSGLDLLALVNGAGLKTQTIFVAREGSEQVAADALNLGAACYLVKGSFDRMLGALDMALGKACHLLELETENEALIDRLRLQNDALEEEVARQTADLSFALEELKGLDKLKSAFITLMSHEIRTPLTSILGFSELISQGICEPAEHMALAEEIRRAGRHLCVFVDELMEYFQWFSGKAEISLAPVRLDSVVRSAQDLVAEKALEKQVEIEVDSDGNSEVEGDEMVLVKAVHRVLDNAVKFSTSGGVVRVVIRGDEGGCLLEVVDEGVGVAPERHGALFRPLEIAGDISNHSQGRGLGLALAQQAVLVHGGRISLHSDGVGQGATVSIHVPREVYSSEPVEEAFHDNA